MRSNIDDATLSGTRQYATRYSSLEATLSGDYTILTTSPIKLILNGGVVDRTVRLPETTPDGGQEYWIFNVGTTNFLNIVDANGLSVGSINAQVTKIYSSTPDGNWKEFGGGVSGPSAGVSTDNAVVRWDGTHGNLLQNSDMILDDTGNAILPGSLTTPIIIGGTAANSTLTLESTSGVGTTDAIIFKTGSQVEHVRFTTDGRAVINNFGYSGGPVLVGGFGGSPAMLQILNNNRLVWDFGFTTYNPTNGGVGGWIIGASRGTGPGAPAASHNGDLIGYFQFDGDDGTADAPGALLQVNVDGGVAPGSVPGRIALLTNPVGGNFPVERLRIDSNGQVAIGTGGGVNTLDTIGSTLQLGVGSSGPWAISAIGYGNNANTIAIGFAKTRGATITSQGAVQNGDILFSFNGLGSDGTNFIGTTTLEWFVDGAVSLNSVPTAFRIRTGPNGYGTERLRIDSTGRIEAGTKNYGTNQLLDGANSVIQVVGDPADWGMAFYSYSASPGPLGFAFASSRSATPGSFSISHDNDLLAQFVAYGDDGTAFVSGACINYNVDGSPSVGSMPIRISFHTGTGGGGPERLRIDSNGRVVVQANSTPYTPVTIDGALARQYVFQDNTGAPWGQINLAFNTFGGIANGGSQVFAATRGTSPTDMTTMQNGDSLGGIAWYGTNGTDYQEAGSITAGVDGVPSSTSFPSRLQFWTTPAGSLFNVERLRIDSQGNTTQGGFPNAAIQGGQSIFQQVSNRVTNADWQLGFITIGNVPYTGGMISAKTRGAAPTTQTIVQNGDNLLALWTAGSDGVDYQVAAAIDTYVDGVPSAGSMPGRIVFSTTPSGSVAQLERLRIDNTGKVTFTNGADTTVLLCNDFGYNLLSLNAGTTASNSIGLLGGLTADNSLYLCVPSGGAYGFSVNNSDVATIDSVGKLGLGAGTLASHWLDILGAGTTTVAPIRLKAGTNLTTAAAGCVEFDGKCFYDTAVASARQIRVDEQIQVLSGTRTFTNNTNAQAIFNASANGAITLAASTTYEFEMLVAASGFSGSAHTISIGFGGTATFTGIHYYYNAQTGTTLAGPTAGATGWVAVATATAVTASTTTTGFLLSVRGVMRINAGGTVIPQLTQNTASAAAVVQTDSFFRCWPIGTNTVTNVGNWS